MTPTIRERLRELAERSWNDEMSDLEWGHLQSQRAKFGVAVRDLIPAIESELDTLERRVRAAEGALETVVAQPFWANWGPGTPALDQARSVLEKRP